MGVRFAVSQRRHHVEDRESIDVDVPVRTAYDQWTQFEAFPRFMDGVSRVQQLDDTTLDWVAEIAGQREALDGRDHRAGARPADRLDVDRRRPERRRRDFDPLDDERTRVTLQLDVEPEGPIEKVGDALGFVERRSRATWSGSRSSSSRAASRPARWRGEVDDGQTRRQQP